MRPEHHQEALAELRPAVRMTSRSPDFFRPSVPYLNRAAGKLRTSEGARAMQTSPANDDNALDHTPAKSTVRWSCTSSPTPMCAPWLSAKWHDLAGERCLAGDRLDHPGAP